MPTEPNPMNPRPGDHFTVLVDGRPYDTIISNIGVQRFVANQLFCFLTANVVNLNALAVEHAQGHFTTREYIEFLMGNGYSVDGFCDLSVCKNLKIENPC